MIIALIFLALISPVKAEAPEPEVKPIPTDVKGMIIYFADKYDVSAERMENTLKCESSLSSEATNITAREHSVGISQINLRAHKDITEAQARDNQFAIEWTAKAFSEGKQSMWSCYNKLYK